MTEKRPIVVYNGNTDEIRDGDHVVGAQVVAGASQSNGQGNGWYHLATLPADNGSNGAALDMDVAFGGLNGRSVARIVIGNRGGLAITPHFVGDGAKGSAAVSRLLAYGQADGTVKIYWFLSGNNWEFFKASLRKSGVTSVANHAVINDNPEKETSEPAGSLDWNMRDHLNANPASEAAIVTLQYSNPSDALDHYRIGDLRGYGSKVRIKMLGGWGWNPAQASIAEAVVGMGSGGIVESWQFRYGKQIATPPLVRYVNVGTNREDVYIRVPRWFRGSIEIVEGWGFTLGDQLHTPINNATNPELIDESHKLINGTTVADSLNIAGSFQLQSYGAGTATFDADGNLTSSSKLANEIKALRKRIEALEK